MELQAITIRNFLSFGPETTLQLADRGLTLIEGVNMDDDTAASNGAGKSALIDAIVWALYGSTIRGYSGDEVVNRHTGQGCAVTLTVLIDDHTYVITRYRKDGPNKNQLTLVVTNGADVRSLTAGTTDATQSVIDKALGMSMSTFLSAVVFGQSAAYRFSQLTDKHQKEILDEALGTAQFARAQDVARLKAREAAALVNTTEAEASRLAAQALRDEADAQALEKSDAMWLTLHTEKLAKAIEAIAALETEAQELEPPADPQAVALPVEADLDALRTRLDKARDHKVTLQARHASIETMRTKAAKLDGRPNCPTCAQALDTQRTAELLAAFDRDLAAVAAELDTARDKLATRQAALTAAQAAAQAATVKAQQQTTAHIRAVAAYNAEAARLKHAITTAKATKAALHKEENPYGDMAAKARKRATKTERDLDATQEALAAAKHERERYDFWVEGFGERGIRSFLIESAVPFLNRTAQNLAQTLTNGAISVTFSAQSALKSGKLVDKFDVAVINRHGAETYKGNSAGERAKVDLIVGLALQALVASRSASVNAVFFDEPFESMDDTATDRVVALLNDTFQGKQSVFVITHNDALKAYFPHVITITKQEGISRIDA